MLATLAVGCSPNPSESACTLQGDNTGSLIAIILLLVMAIVALKITSRGKEIRRPPQRKPYAPIATGDGAPKESGPAGSDSPSPDRRRSAD